MIGDDIIRAVATGLEALTAVTESGSTNRYRIAELPLESAPQDRAFEVATPGGELRATTGQTGKCDRALSFVVRMSLFNEGLDRAEYFARVVEDAQRIQDYVPAYVRANVAGVGDCSDAGPWALDDTAEPRLKILRIPFSVEYVDDIVTS